MTTTDEVTRVTTDFVRRHYSKAPTAYRTEGSIAQVPTVEDVAYCERQFDEWLARHDAEVRAAALFSPPADDVREALARLIDPNAHAARWYINAHDVRDQLAGLRIKRGVYEVVDRILSDPRFEVRLRGTVTDAEVKWEYGVSTKWGPVPRESFADAQSYARRLVAAISERRDSGDLRYHGQIMRRRAATEPGEWERIEADHAARVSAENTTPTNHTNGSEGAGNAE